MCGKKSFYDKSFVIFCYFLGLRELGPKTSFWVPVLKCSYLSFRAVTKSKNRITGVFWSKFIAVAKEKLKRGSFRGKKKIRRFLFFSKILPKTKNTQKS